MYESTPIMYVFAGNNGSGKSTIRNLIVDRLGISVNIDPDALARGIDSIQNLLSHLHLMDHLIVIDNSHTEGEITFEISQGSILYRADNLPQWVEIIERKYFT